MTRKKIGGLIKASDHNYNYQKLFDSVASLSNDVTSVTNTLESHMEIILT